MAPCIAHSLYSRTRHRERSIGADGLELGPGASVPASLIQVTRTRERWRLERANVGIRLLLCLVRKSVCLPYILSEPNNDLAASSHYDV